MIQLIIAYTLVGAFVFTVVITCLSLVGWIKFANKKQQQKLFAALIVQLVIGCVGFFTQLLQFNPSTVANELVEQGKAIRQIQDEIKERHIPSDKKAALTDILSKIQKCKTDVYAVDGDREAIHFSKEIYGVLKDAGWPVNALKQDIIIGGTPSGLLIIQKPWDASYGMYLKYVFSLYKFDVALGERKDMPTNTVEFWVGTRP